MELSDFLRETQVEVRAQVSEGSPFAELAFSEVVMQHMADIGMTFEPVVCHYAGKVGNANLRLSGYAMSDDADQLDLFVSLYDGVDEPTPVVDSETKTAAEQCLRFLVRCAEGRMATLLDESSDVKSLALTIQENYPKFDQIRIYVLTDRVAKAKSFKARELGGKTVKLDVMDIQRLHRHWSEGKPRDELVVDFAEVSGGPLPCVFVPGQTSDYDYALTAIPGEALRFIYEKFGARLLEANVRSFLSATGKVNQGIRDTLRSDPERFMAYNNGIVLVADEIKLDRTADGAPGILWLKGMQVVNGGQTTASLYFTKKKFPELDLARVRVPAKIIVMRVQDAAKEEALVSDISRFANSQNSVKQSDLSANKPFHVEVEKLSMTVYCPDGIGRWFYERASGSYNTMLIREGTTPVKLRQLKEAVPPARKITKTDLAKYVNVWDCKPDLVSLGSQKNFERFMATLSGSNEEVPLPDVAGYKAMVAKAIVFKATQKIVRPMFQAFQANVAAYVVAVLADKLGTRMDLDRIWMCQDISSELRAQIARWAKEVGEILHRTAGGRMVSEWAKKPECREAVLGASYSAPSDGIPEMR